MTGAAGSTTLSASVTSRSRGPDSDTWRVLRFPCGASGCRRCRSPSGTWMACISSHWPRYRVLAEFALPPNGGVAT